MLQIPSCLHVPVLYEEATAKITWEPVVGAVSYQLECVFDESFEQAGTGRSWTALDAGERTWAQREAEGLSWAQLAKLPAQGCTWQNIEHSGLTWDMLATKNRTWREIELLPVSFIIFNGVGVPTRAPDQGLTWGLLESKGLSWSELEVKNLNWLEYELLLSSGLTWSQLEGEGYTWTRMEEQGKTWRQLAELPSRGISWESLDALYLPWNEREANGLTWKALEQLPPENNTHMSFPTTIPLYKKLACYRVRAFNGTNYSGYLTSTLLPIAPRSLASYKPPCLHIPALHEAESAKIVWGELYGTADYVLERAFTGGFSVRYEGVGTPTDAPSDCNAGRQMKYAPDCKRHLSYPDVFPIGERQVTYRIKGRNATNESQYLTSAVIPIIPAFYREDSTTVSVVAGARYHVQLYARGIEAFKAIVMRLIYSAQLLSVEQFASDQPTSKTDMGSTPYVGNARELARKSGEISFLCTRAMQRKKQWDGLIVCVRFRALKTGLATIELC